MSPKSKMLPQEHPFTQTVLAKAENGQPLSEAEIEKMLSVYMKGSDSRWACWEVFDAVRVSHIESTGLYGYNDSTIRFAAAQIATHLLMPKISRIHERQKNARINSDVNEDFRSLCLMACMDALDNYDPSKSMFTNHVAPYLEQVGITFEKDQSHYMQKKDPVYIHSADVKVDEDGDCSIYDMVSSDYSLEKSVVNRERQTDLRTLIRVAAGMGLLTEREREVRQAREQAISEGKLQLGELDKKSEVEAVQKRIDKDVLARQKEINENMMICAKFLNGIPEMPYKAKEAFVMELNKPRQEEEEVAL